MKKVLYTLLTLCLLFGTTLTAQAYTTPSGTTSSGTPSGGGGGGGSGEPAPPPAGSSGTITGSVGGASIDADINFPFNVYTPKVTYIKSVNAALANYDGIPVYFMPKLEDFPTDLENVVSDLTDNTGVRHQFAAVYTGYFDTDVVYVSAQAGDANNTKLKTSKKVYSSEDNSRLLNLLGYDLLLQKESFDIKVENGNISMGYSPTRLTSGWLRADTCIMDLYKAMGVYEWDIEFAFGVDPNLDVEKSPILQMIPNLTSGEKNKGFDTTESVVWVAATRTNPDQYWNRCLQDAIFDGGLHNITAANDAFIGSEASVSFSLNSGDQVSLGEFCSLARAIMTLYGEPVMTVAEQEKCLLAYGVTVPANSYTKEVRDSIVYLAAKGIIDPTQKNFNQNVTFADIEDILLRIADESARLTVKTQNISLLADQGFSTLNRVAISSGQGSLEMIDSEDLQYRDFLIELNDETTFYMTQSRQGYVAQDTSKPTANYRPFIVVDEQGSRVSDGSKAMSTENIAILLNGVPQKQQSGLWQNVGIEEYTDIGGKVRSFYHFKINTDKFGSLNFVSADTYEEGTGTNFTLENENGGIYYYQDGWQYERFSDYLFDDTYRDDESTSFVDSPLLLSSSKQMAGLYVDSNTLNLAKSFKTADVGNGYHWENLFDNSGNIKEGRVEIDQSLWVSIIQPDSMKDKDMFRIELYGTNLNRVMQTTFMSTLINGGAVKESSNVGFYRAEDNTLLVSTGYLSQSGRITSFDDMGKGVYVMGVRSVLGGRTTVDTNVVIYDDESNGFIMVGDTLFPRSNGEVLIEQVGMEYYVNAKALTGWAADLVLVPNGDNSCAVAIDSSLYNRSFTNINNDKVKSSGSTARIRTIPGGTENIVATLTNVAFSPKGGNRESFNGSGIMLTSAYSLANYCLVMADDNGTDYLFVYHIRGLEGSKGESGDGDARSMFAKLTGFNLESDPTYYLTMYRLDRKTYGNSFGGSNRTTVQTAAGKEPLHYVEQTLHGKAISEQTVTWGWTYSPVTTTNLLDAAKEYASGNSDQFKLPFAYYQGKIYDININVCKASETASDFEPIGTLPSYMFGNTSKKIGKLSSNLNVTHSAPPSGNVFSDYKITAAPVGNFAFFKASTNSTIEKLKTSNLYWGTVKVSYSSAKKSVCIENVPVSLDGSTPVTRTYMGAALNSVYVVQTSESNITKLLDEASDAIDSLIGRDAESLVDWDKYTFNRLIENLDSWSSIVLIFILNILPRVCILLYFALMLLSLIKDVRPFRAFCNSVFDVFKFLTFGHQSVETIDLKRTILTSIICLALFYMIMDGSLFIFIMWICEWFLVLMQK